jgi:hypothetical protein
VPPLTIEYIDRVLAPRYRDAGFEVIERGVLARSEWRGLKTSWAKRLGPGAGRTVMYLVARAARSLS